MSSQDKSIKIIFLGDPESKKTSVIQSILQQFGSGLPNCSFVNLNIDGQPVHLEIVDSSGQERYTNLSPIYKDAKICVLIYNEAIKESFENVDKWKKDFILNLGLQNAKDFPFLLIGNNPDGAPIVVEDSAAQEYAENNNMMFYRFSSHDDDKLRETFKAIIKKSFEGKPKETPATNENHQSEQNGWRCLIC
ncbi:hypothetical protein M9Y10_020906 [Tritrichomonas musculus]|uniref:Small GTP-binding protein n=1 Tax=Tritrichomonas musculus TaxID=1915356 RepID=A0ABR2HFZ3_9EUKA